ncbi:MAG: DUF4856 domain-containing protein, partial [Polaribacter sp.]
MKRIFLTFVLAASIISCSKENNDTPKTVVAPSTYKFERDANSTVSFSGQTTRIKMALAFIAALKTTSETVTTLSAKFAHAAGDTDFKDTDLNTSAKNIRSKVAASKDFFSANTTDATVI